MKVKDNFEQYNRAKLLADGLSDLVLDKFQDSAEIKEWLEQEDSGRELIKKLSNEQNIVTIVDRFEQIECGKEQNIRKLILAAAKAKRVKTRKVFVKTLISSCAAVSVIFFALLYFYDGGVSGVLRSNKMVVAEKPILILSSGKSIDLKANSSLIEDGEMVVNKENDRLDYKKAAISANIGEHSFHSLLIPKEQRFSITLSDGTEVTLNANSELRYQPLFAGDSRKVYLKGEAYFNVKKDSKPFIVDVDGVSVTVYGTEFNVNSHIKNQVQTTLISGSVGITMKTGEKIMIKPNQRSVVSLTDNSCEVSTVNVAQYISWLKGDFIYEDINVVNMLDDISAWYGVEIYYDAKLFENVSVNAAFNRTEPVDKILKYMGEILDVKFIKTESKDYVIE